MSGAYKSCSTAVGSSSPIHFAGTSKSGLGSVAESNVGIYSEWYLDRNSLLSGTPRIYPTAVPSPESRTKPYSGYNLTYGTAQIKGAIEQLGS